MWSETIFNYHPLTLSLIYIAPGRLGWRMCGENIINFRLWFCHWYIALPARHHSSPWVYLMIVLDFVTDLPVVLLVTFDPIPRGHRGGDRMCECMFNENPWLCDWYIAPDMLERRRIWNIKWIGEFNLRSSWTRVPKWVNCSIIVFFWLCHEYYISLWRCSYVKAWVGCPWWTFF